MSMGDYAEQTYFEDGAPCSCTFYSWCPCCGGKLRVHRLCDDTGGGEFCLSCGYSNNW